MEEAKKLFEELKQKEETYLATEEKLKDLSNEISVRNLLKQNTLPFLLVVNVKIFNNFKDLVDLPESTVDVDSYNGYYYVIQVVFNCEFVEQLIKLCAKLNAKVDNAAKTYTISKSINISQKAHNLVLTYNSDYDPIDSLVDITLFAPLNEFWTVTPIKQFKINISYFFQFVEKPIPDFKPTESLISKLNKISNIYNKTGEHLPVESEDQVVLKIDIGFSVGIHEIYTILLKNCAHQSELSTLEKISTNNYQNTNEFLYIAKSVPAKIVIDLNKRFIAVKCIETFGKKVVKYIKSEIALLNK